MRIVRDDYAWRRENKKLAYEKEVLKNKLERTVGLVGRGNDSREMGH